MPTARAGSVGGLHRADAAFLPFDQAGGSDADGKTVYLSAGQIDVAVIRFVLVASLRCSCCRKRKGGRTNDRVNHDVLDLLAEAKVVD